MSRILLIGATGCFGQRLAALLARLPETTLIVTSRSLDKAQALASRLAPSAAAFIEPIALCHGAGANALFENLRPWLVIDASGPFQSANYDTARAAILCGAHWIDLADAASYILGFADELDALARARGVRAITGASSTPALSCAAARAITAGWSRVDNVDVGIYPAGSGLAGRAVIDAVLSYAGAPVAICCEGRTQTRIGWGDAERAHVPGLGWRWRSCVATADYALMPELTGARNVTFYAGLESPLEHLGLVGLAKARSRGLVTSLAPLSPLLHQARRLTIPFSGEEGAMLVEARGVDENHSPVTAQWHLSARDGDGPNVPVLAALALTKKLLKQRLGAGASSSARALDLSEIEAEMYPFALETSRSAKPARYPQAA